MKPEEMPTLDILIRSNPKVDPELVASARAAIEEIRKNGFVSAGYRLAGRRTLLTDKQTVPTRKQRLPRRRR